MSKQSDDIGIKTSYGTIEPFTDNSIPMCARCNIRLTDENRSGWSDVTAENKTQYVCKNCLTQEEKDVNETKT